MRGLIYFLFAGIVGVVLFVALLGGMRMFNSASQTATISSMTENAAQSPVADVAQGKAILIDVRTDEEWAAGHAKGAMHFDLARLEQGELPQVSRYANVYLYCRSGGRAGKAKTILEQNGYANVVNLGGLSDWQALGGAVEK